MSVMATPKKRPGRPPASADEKKQQINVTLAKKVFDSLESFRLGGEFKIERSDVIERALEAYLATKGHWPPKDA